MAATKRKTTAASNKKATARAKPKSAKNASAKNVKRSSASPKRATTRSTARQSSAPKQQASTASVQPDAMLKIGTDTIRQMMGSMGAAPFQEDVQKQMMSVSKESATQLAKSADAASKSFNEIFSLGKDNMDAAVTCSSIAVNASKSMGAELFNYANKSFSQNVEMSKEIFGCRTINDMFDLQSKVVKSNLDHFFNESVKMSEMLFQCANEVSEPINQRVSENTNRISKAMAEAA